MSDPDRPTAPARLTTPRLSARPTSTRPGRPGRQPARAVEAVVELPPTEPIIAETTVVALPPAPAPPPRRPSVFAAARTRQTLFPPCVVLAIGFAALGVAYFLQPPDAALRQIRPVIPVLILLFGLLAGASAVGLARSLRRIDSTLADS